MSGLIKTLIEITRCQKGVDYGATEICEAVNDGRERSQTGGDEELQLADILGLSDGPESDRGET